MGTCPRWQHWAVPSAGDRPNERLRSALASAGMTHAELARAVGVTEKAVSLWVTKGTLPHARNQRQVAMVLGASQKSLFPEGERLVGDAKAEIVSAWPRRGDAPMTLWWDLFSAAESRIDVLGYATLFLTENHLDLVDHMMAKAENGCGIRILLADPDCDAVTDRDREEQLGGTLAARIRSAIIYYAPLFDTPVEMRLQVAPMYNSIFRFDDQMLVTNHLYGTPGKMAPLLHHHRLGSDGLFDRYNESFELLWCDSKPAARPT